MHSITTVMFGSYPQLPLVLAALLPLLSCGTNAPEAPRDEAAEKANSGGKIEHATWELQAGADVFEGNMALVARSSGKIHLQLINADAVNLAILFSEGASPTREVEHSFFAVERGQRCQLVASDPPYQVTLDSADGIPLKGSFAGTLGCPDHSALPVKGSFEVSEAGE